MQDSNTDNRGSGVRWRRRLPIVVGVIYLVAASPFLLGILIPSFHEGNTYSALFLMTVLPVVLVSGGLIDGLVQDLNFHVGNAVLIFLAWCLWVGLSFGIGVVMDKFSSRRQKQTA